MGKKVLRKNYGARRMNGEYEELEIIFRELDIATEIQKNRIGGQSHVPMDNRAVKKVFNGNPGGRRRRGRHRKKDW